MHLHEFLPAHVAVLSGVCHADEPSLHDSLDNVLSVLTWVIIFIIIDTVPVRRLAVNQECLNHVSPLSSILEKLEP